MNNVAIVIIAYNRPQALLRLLDSLTNAYYPQDLSVPLIISVDKSDSTQVADVARDYVWEHGDKSVRLQEENLGLRKHVLKCGDISGDYDGIIMLEDDLYVSPMFYMYALTTLEWSASNSRICGVSLYDHRLNVHAREPFEAIDDGYDNYYLQLASSWGQAFTGDQWKGFREWYEIHKDDDIAADNVPENISSWSDKSWLKYYIKYLIVNDGYFLYPRISYTTNFGDEGTHADSGVNDLQVPLAGMRNCGQVDLRLADIDESGAVYDAYFENQRLSRGLPESVRDEVTIDMYGMKQNAGYKRYVLSSRPLPYRILESFARKLRPIDANVVYKIEGKDFFLYDTGKPGKAPDTDDAGRYMYNYRALKVKEMTSVIKYRLKSKLHVKPKKVHTEVSSEDKTVGENRADNNTAGT